MLEKIITEFGVNIQQDAETFVLTVSAETDDEAFEVKCDLREALEREGYRILDDYSDHDSVQVVITVPTELTGGNYANETCCRIFRTDYRR